MISGLENRGKYSFFVLFVISSIILLGGCAGLNHQPIPPQNTAPTTPANLAAASASATQINLTWSPSTDTVGVTGYDVERCQGAGCSNFTQITTTVGITFNDTGLSPSTSYSYRVRAKDGAGNASSYSSVATATTQAPAFTAPSNLTATAASSTQINLAWTAATETGGTISKYLVERCKGAGCTNFVQVATPTTTSYNDTGLTASTTYNYRVRASDTSGNDSAYSNTATATTSAPNLPTAPANLAATAAGPVQINLAWTASTETGGTISQYLVERCQGAGCSNFAQVGTSTTTSYNDVGLTASTSYSYRVRAKDAANNLGPYSSTATASTAAPILTAPSNLSATAASSSQINLGWTASTETGGTISKYLVERCQGAGCSNFAQIATPAATSFNDTGLTASTSYSYRVRATDASNNLSPYSNIASATTSAAASVTVTVSPVRGSVTTSEPQQFTATVMGSANTSVTWEVDGNNGGNSTTGTISASGLFTPGTQPGLHAITAVSVANASASASASLAVTDLQGVFTHHYDPQRTGQNLKEYALAPATLSSSTFGSLFSCSVNEGGSVPGYTYAQPLYVANLLMPDNKMHNVVYVATESDFVYAFDADASPCQLLWKASMLDAAHGAAAGATTVPDGDTGETGDLVPEIGITSTPVIDPSSNTIYVSSKTKEPGPVYVHRLHALDLTTGLEKFGGPATITASGFDPLVHMQRPALLLSNGIVYVAFGSHGDHNTYHGWVMGYTASPTLTQTFVWASSDLSSNTMGAVWGAGAGPALDSSGNVWVETANGNFDGSVNYGDSVVKLNSSGSVVDFFTPFDQDTLRANDVDLGSGGVVILPDSVGSAAHPHLAVATGKPGGFYLLDQTHLGQFNSSTNQDVQEVFPQGLNETAQTSGVFGLTAYWNSSLYIAVIGDNLRQYSIANGTISSNSVSNSTQSFPYPATIPAISANGNSGGIVWVVEIGSYRPSNPAILHAFDATNLATQLYASPSSGSGAAGKAVKFTVPTVANGKVYVAGQGQLTVFGLLPH